MTYPPDNPLSEAERSDTGTSIPSMSSATEEQKVVIPVVEEELEVHKVVHATGSVRIQKIVHQSEKIVSEDLTSDTIHVERVPMDVIVESPPPVRTEGEVTIIPVLKEVLVLTKQLHLVEELRITRRSTVVNQQQTVTLRAEELVVDRQTQSD
ncbi:MAG: YsnF/AvaK domain-containing protein [Acidobacteriota bacterium]|nr:YsnF/AvaK domain-containing protein [Acidobacteriota bacterium]